MEVKLHRIFEMEGSGNQCFSRTQMTKVKMWSPLIPPFIYGRTLLIHLSMLTVLYKVLYLVVE